METKTYLMFKTDSTAFIMQHNKETNEWQIFEFVSWMNHKDPIANGDEVVKWFETNGAQLEAGFPVDEDNYHAVLTEAELLEYTELMDELDVRL